MTNKNAVNTINLDTQLLEKDQIQIQAKVTDKTLEDLAAATHSAAKPEDFTGHQTGLKAILAELIHSTYSNKSSDSEVLADNAKPAATATKCKSTLKTALKDSRK